MVIYFNIIIEYERAVILRLGRILQGGGKYFLNLNDFIFKANFLPILKLKVLVYFLSYRV